MKRNNTFRWILIAFFIVVSVYYLFPSFRYLGLSEQDKADMKIAGDLVDLQKKAIKLGLDLQGGIHIIQEVDFYSLVEVLAENKDDIFYTVLNKTRDDDLRSDDDFFDILERNARDEKLILTRYFTLNKTGDKSPINYLKDESLDAIDKVREILNNRIDQFGIAEPNIRKSGDKRILIELPGITDPERARELINRTAQLEFRLLKEPEVTGKVIRDIDKFLQREKFKIEDLADTTVAAAEEDTNLVAESKPSKDKEMSMEEFFGQNETASSDSDTSSLSNLLVDEETFEEMPFTSLLRNFGEMISCSEQNYSAVFSIIERAKENRIIPRDAEFFASSRTFAGGDGNNYYKLYLIKKDTELTGEVITDARANVGSGYDPRSAGQPVVNMSMNKTGARAWSRITGANINKQIAIILDEKVFSAPNVNVKIRDGNSVIEGIPSMEEAKDLALVLRVGALPAKVDIIEERTVGPSLGADSIRKGAYSTVIGLILVVIFMIIYYRMSGLIANVAVFFTLFFLMAILAAFHATLTLPGIAGILLTIGMSVDANVLIFERIREELASGKTVRASIDTGYARAFRTILDANVTTLITAVILFNYGTGPIRGFAFTLGWGIVASMFSAIIITRCFFDFFTEKWAIRKLSI